MGIIRTVHNNENPYAMINKRAIDNPNLTFKATGLYSYLMGKPDNWKISIEHLSGVKPDGAKAVRSALRELEAEGYITRSPVRNENGVIKEWEHLIFEFPIEVTDEIKENKITPALAERKRRVRDKLSKSIPKYPEHQDISPDAQNGQVAKFDTNQPYVQNVHVANGHVENRHVENDTLIINDLNNKEINNTDSKDIENGAPATLGPPTEEPKKPDDEIHQVDFSQIPKEAIRLAQKLATTVRANHPYKPELECPQPVIEPGNRQLFNWAKEINMINYLGPFLTKKTETDKGIPWAVIEAAIDYLPKKPHWKNKVISGLELRKCISAIIGDITEEKEIAMRRKPYAGRNQTAGGQPNNKPISAASKFEPFDDEGFYCQFPDESRQEMLLRIDADPRCNDEKLAYFIDAVDKGKLRIS